MATDIRSASVVGNERSSDRANGAKESGWNRMPFIIH